MGAATISILTNCHDVWQQIDSTMKNIAMHLILLKNTLVLWMY